ncbi:MAG: PRC-barrel domain-containing protein [Acutalibacteraceae bacterium]
MNCRITDLRAKEVICVKDGSRLGNVCDVEIDTCTGQLCAIIVFGRARAGAALAGGIMISVSHGRIFR